MFVKLLVANLANPFLLFLDGGGGGGGRVEECLVGFRVCCLLWGFGGVFLVFGNLC